MNVNRCFGKVSPGAITVLMRIASAELSYDCMMGRSANVCPAKASGVFQRLNPERYLQRLLTPAERAATVERIEWEKPKASYA